VAGSCGGDSELPVHRILVFVGAAVIEEFGAKALRPTKAAAASNAKA
jgi:hypothetical protein